MPEQELTRRERGAAKGRHSAISALASILSQSRTLATSDDTSALGQHAEPAHAIRLLRTRDERPGRNSATDEHDEFPPPHEICSP
jgi:hypothetical protein